MTELMTFEVNDKALAALAKIKREIGVDSDGTVISLALGLLSIAKVRPHGSSYMANIGGVEVVLTPNARKAEHGSDKARDGEDL